MAISIAPRRLASMASASALIATIVVASAPAAALAATPASGATGFFRDGHELTAKQIGGVATGNIDADGFDIGVYNPDRVINANIHDALYYGIVVNGGNVDTTGSKVHDIGDSPFDGTQRGRAILYINGANGTISGNNVYDFQKNGIEVRGVTADAGADSTTKTSATIVNNLITGRGHIGDIAQNGIVILGNASATVKNNIVSGLWYTGPADTYATGLLNVDGAALTVSGNKVVDAQVRFDGELTANVTGHSTKTIRAHGVRIDLFSNARPAAQAELGAKLDWKVKVDGRLTFHTKQGFDDQDVVRQHFATGSGRHVVTVIKNNTVVRNFAVRF